MLSECFLVLPIFMSDFFHTFLMGVKNKKTIVSYLHTRGCLANGIICPFLMYYTVNEMLQQEFDQLSPSMKNNHPSKLLESR